MLSELKLQAVRIQQEVIDAYGQDPVSVFRFSIRDFCKFWLFSQLFVLPMPVISVFVLSYHVAAD